MNDVEQTLKFSAILKILWKDAGLVWVPGSYGNVTELLYPQEKVWLPDVTIFNSLDSLGYLGFDRNYVL
jgi:hypothetical protein